MRLHVPITLFQVLFLSSFVSSLDKGLIFGTSPRANLSFSELTAYDGYTSENFTVTTADGYLLSLFRIPIQKSCKTSKGSILFMHGLSLSGDDCIVPGPGRAHCYIYADNCYDMWVGNTRGNRYSRKHLTLDPDTCPEFWDFAFDEIALYDLPAIIDFILKRTGEKQISYIGHSQGVSILIILCCKKTEYNNKIKVGFSLSGTAWWSQSQYYFKQPIFQLYRASSPILTTLTNNGINLEMVPYGSDTLIMRKFMCLISTVPYPYCTILEFAIGGYNQKQIWQDLLPVISGHTPNGASLKNLNRWLQIKINGFSEYDYGIFENWRLYKSHFPPMYKIKNLKMPWVFVASSDDNVAKVSDLKLLTDKMDNYDTCIHRGIQHLDFVYGKIVQSSVAPMILNYLETGTTTCCF